MKFIEGQTDSWEDRLSFYLVIWYINNSEMFMTKGG